MQISGSQQNYEYNYKSQSTCWTHASDDVTESHHSPHAQQSIVTIL